jgi:alkylation response protein AidB-like acyl-CoA dehydrogenase
LAAVAEDMAKRLWSTREYENLWVASSDCRRREWDEIAEVGLLDIRVPTEYGGLGLGWSELGAVLRAIGLAPIAGPLLDTCLARPLIASSDVGAGEKVEEDLRGLARSVSIVDAWAATPSADETQYGLRWSDGTLSGNAPLVRFPRDATLFLTVAYSDIGPVIGIVMPGAKGISITSRDSSDPFSSYGSVAFDGVSTVRAVAAGDKAVTALNQLRRGCRLLAACEMSGLAHRMVEASVTYAAQRRQFGKLIGEFQAVQHLLAQMHVDSVGLTNLVDMICHDSDIGGEIKALDACKAKGYASEVCRRVMENAFQVHGGIGFTAEYLLDPYIKRALALQGFYGDEYENYYVIGRNVSAAGDAVDEAAGCVEEYFSPEALESRRGPGAQT